MRIVHLGRLFLLCAVVLALLPAVHVIAAVDAFITITGSRQGPIRGEEASGAIHLVSVTRDAATGQAVGKRMHSTITISKHVDQASPQFFKALNTHERLSNVTITFQGASGGAKTAQRITLTNATILSARKHGDLEEFTLDYESIEVTWVNGGKTMNDDWEAPN